MNNNKNSRRKDKLTIKIKATHDGVAFRLIK